jgi:hypothetical protein
VSFVQPSRSLLSGEGPKELRHPLNSNLMPADPERKPLLRSVIVISLFMVDGFDVVAVLVEYVRGVVADVEVRLEKARLDSAHV